MPKSKTLLLTKQQKEVMADALARFFFGYWQKQSERDNKVAALRSGSTHREGSPALKVAS